MNTEDLDLGDVNEFEPPATGTPRLISFLKSAMNDPEPDLYQAVLDLGYTEWQRPEHQSWSFADMINWVGETLGDDAKLITMLGKFNQQVSNGGIVQWLDNGYASNSHRRGSQGISPQMNLDLLEQMLDLLSSTTLGRSFTLADKVKDILNDIVVVIEDSDQDCRSCRNHRYVRCEDCGGTGYIEDDGGNDTDCPTCGGEGEVPCEDCNAEGQLESDAQHGEVNYKSFEWLDKAYYKIETEWTKEIESWLRRLVQGPKGNELSRTQAIKATESILSMLDKLLESMDDK